MDLADAIDLLARLEHTIAAIEASGVTIVVEVQVSTTVQLRPTPQ